MPLKEFEYTPKSGRQRSRPRSHSLLSLRRRSRAASEDGVSVSTDGGASGGPLDPETQSARSGNVGHQQQPHSVDGSPGSRTGLGEGSSQPGGLTPPQKLTPAQHSNSSLRGSPIRPRAVETGSLRSSSSPVVNGGVIITKRASVISTGAVVYDSSVPRSRSTSPGSPRITVVGGGGGVPASPSARPTEAAIILPDDRLLHLESRVQLLEQELMAARDEARLLSAKNMLLMDENEQLRRRLASAGVSGSNSTNVPTAQHVVLTSTPPPVHRHSIHHAPPSPNSMTDRLSIDSSTGSALHQFVKRISLEKRASTNV